jgi:DNA-directed RNA polymerase specialized sigma subunit
MTERLHDTLGRMPTDVELADEVGLSVGRIQKLRNRVGLALSESQMVDMEGNPVSPATSVSRPASFGSEAVDEGLTPEKKLIYDWKTGAHGRDVISNKEIAERLHVSAPYITQVSQGIAQKIQEVSGYGIR